MRTVLVIGSGGREHALAWKLAQSPQVGRIYVTPGNGGTALERKTENVELNETVEIVEFARRSRADLVIVGPEAPLAAGVSDALRAAGIAVFGPSQAAAQIESSKAFAKAFMARHGIPTARYHTFSDYAAALAHIRTVDYPLVIKASGLAAGKGVILPDTLAEAERALEQIMVVREFGAAGAEVVIEERLIGEEVSLLAFCDGVTVKAMPPAQDHKRLLAGDHGPNTGGMGAYAPTPVCPPDLVAALTAQVLQPAVDGLRAEGAPFVGVLYAGLMLTEHGPRVLEYNARFGDPETQVLLPLLQNDLYDLALACVEGRLAELEIRWLAGAAACVVLASEGYPGPYAKGQPIHGLDPLALPTNSIVFHAGTRQRVNGEIVTAGGRVLGVTGWGSDFRAALDTAYAAVGRVTFRGAQYRRDIGGRALAALDKR